MGITSQQLNTQSSSKNSKNKLKQPKITSQNLYIPTPFPSLFLMENEQEVVSEPEPAQQPEVIVINKPQSKFQDYMLRLKRFIGECRRGMKVIQKPNKEEFITTAKVSAAGIAILGLVGFILSMIQQLII